MGVIDAIGQKGVEFAVEELMVNVGKTGFSRHDLRAIWWKGASSSWMVK